MSTYTWLGGSALWTNEAFWSENGGTPTFLPSFSDTALIDAPGAYTVLVPTANPGFLDIGDPSATIEVQTSLIVGGLSGGFQNAGSVVVDSFGTLMLGELSAFYSNVNYAYQNTGVIQVGTGANLIINMNVASNQLGTLVNNGGTIIFGGSVDNAGRVFPSAGLGAVFDTGEIAGGTIDDSAGTMQFGGFLSGVTWLGNMRLSSVAIVSDGFTLEPPVPGQTTTIDVVSNPHGMQSGFSSSSDSVIAGETLDNLLVRNSATLGDFSFSGTVGPHVTVDTSLAAGAQLTIYSPTFLGTILAGGTCSFGGTLDGRIEAAPGSTLIFSANAVDTGNNGLVTLNDANMLVQGGSIAGDGTIALSNGATAAFDAGYGGQVFSMLDGTDTLVFTDPAGTNTILGFQPGDTIEIPNQGVSVGFTNSTLTLTNGPALNAVFVLPGVPANAQFHRSMDGNLDSFITETTPCFAAGTRLATTAGDVPVEALRLGDRMRIASGRTVPVVWLGHRRVACQRHPRPWDVMPVRILSGAFGRGVPGRDVWLSPDHAIHVAGVLIPARYLVNGATIVQEPRDEITYWHVELPEHDVLLADGLPVESYLDTGNRGAFAESETPVHLHPDFALSIWQAKSCAPLVRDGATLVAVRRRLRRRAQALGFALADQPDLRLLAAGQSLTPRLIAGRLHRFALPATATELVIASRAAVPAEIAASNPDHRRLGVMIERILLRRPGWQHDIPLAELPDGHGFHPLERNATNTWRWTDGHARLPLPPTQAPLLIDLHIAAAQPSWLAPSPPHYAARKQK